MHLQDTSNKIMPDSACIVNDTRVDTDPCSLVFHSSSEIKMYPLSPFGMQTQNCSLSIEIGLSSRYILCSYVYRNTNIKIFLLSETSCAILFIKVVEYETDQLATERLDIFVSVSKDNVYLSSAVVPLYSGFAEGLYCLSLLYLIRALRI